MTATRRHTAILKTMRIEHEKAAGEDWPRSHLKELLLLYDIGTAEDLIEDEFRDVLGDEAYEFVESFLNTPLDIAIGENAVALFGL